MQKCTIDNLTYQAKGLYYWSKVFTEGHGIKAKIRLIPNTIFRLIYYITGTSYNLVIRFAPDVKINNRNGIFKCRKGCSDIQVIAEGYERNLTSYLRKVQSGIFVDIGANIGRYTIMTGKQMKDRGKVVAIEADPENFEALVENIKLNNLDNVYAFNAACCDKEGEIKFLMQPLEAKLFSSLKVDPFLKSEAGGSRVITIHSTTLDNILKGLGIETVAIVKIDAEKAEKDVLLGMKETMSNGPMEILFEVENRASLNECGRIMQDYGFLVDDKILDSSSNVFRARKMSISKP